MHTQFGMKMYLILQGNRGEGDKQGEGMMGGSVVGGGSN